MTDQSFFEKSILDRAAKEFINFRVVTFSLDNSDWRDETREKLGSQVDIHVEFLHTIPHLHFVDCRILDVISRYLGRRVIYGRTLSIDSAEWAEERKRIGGSEDQLLDWMVPYVLTRPELFNGSNYYPD